MNKNSSTTARRVGKKVESCKVVILAGGEGTRLYPLTLIHPKAMLPLGSSPVMENLIKHMKKSGFTDFIITVNYLKDQFMHYIDKGYRLGVKVEYAIEPEGVFLGTAGSVKLASDLLNQTFIVLQGDTFTTIDVRKALDFHRQVKADATIILKEVTDPWNYGTAVCNSDGRITAFQEKPQKGEELSNLVSTGMYCLEPDVLDFVSSGEVDFAKNVFPRILDEGKRLFGFIGKGFWTDIGSLKGYLEGTKYVLETHVVPSELRRKNTLIGNNLFTDESIKIKQPVLIENNVTISKECQIGPYVVLQKGVNVDENSVIENTTVLKGSNVGAFCQIRKSIIGEQACLKDKVVVESSIIGPGSIIEESAQVKNGGRVWPGIKITPNTIVDGTLVLPSDKPFLFHADIGKYIGTTANNIEDLLNILQNVDIESIKFHLYRGDLERWIRDVFKTDLLADRIYNLRKEELVGEQIRKKMIDLIRDWLNPT